MKKKIGVLLIHGAGKSQFGPQIKFVEKVEKQFKKQNIVMDDFAFEHVDWYEPTQTIQEKLWSRLNSKKQVRARKIREFILYLVSDMIAYTGTPNRESENYFKTHELIYQSIRNLEEQLEENAPLVIIASSLGTTLINDYIWDRQKNESNDAWLNTPFQRFETLCGFFMFGNNIPLFITGYDPDNWKPINFPSEKLSPELQAYAEWINYYDGNDPLGFPLKNINHDFKNSTLVDKEINVGSILLSWNLGSHLAYWKSKKLINKITSYLATIRKQ
jgi:hypothetical protein